MKINPEIISAREELDKLKARYPDDWFARLSTRYGIESARALIQLAEVGKQIEEEKRATR